MSKTLPLGVYVGNPNGNDPSAEADVENAFNAVASTIGRTPTTMDTYIDISQGWSGMVASAGWNAWSWAQSPVAHSLTPVIAVPMGYWGDSGIGTLEAIASGAHDDVYRGIAQAWRDEGFTTAYMRIGWEMNGGFMPWSMGYTEQSAQAWAAAFAHIADVVRSVPGIDIKTVWNPNLANNDVVDVRHAYPGDQYVDVIAIDAYSPTWKYDNSVSDSQYYNYPAASQYNPQGVPSVQWGLEDMISFARAHGKPVGIGEAGVAVGQSNALPGTIAADLSAPDAPPTAFINVWDIYTGEGNWQFTGGVNPGAASAWAAALGGSGGSSPTGGGGGGGSSPTGGGSGGSAGSGSGAQKVVYLGAGNDTISNTSGPVRAIDDGNPDNFVVHRGGAAMDIADINFSKGDHITIDWSLHDSLQETAGPNGVTISFSGSSNTQPVTVEWLQWVDSTALSWDFSR